MKGLLVVAAIVALVPGCASFDGMSAAQIREAVKDKSFTVTCVTNKGLYGTTEFRIVNLDDKASPNGAFTVDKDCGVQFVNSKLAPPVAPIRPLW